MLSLLMLGVGLGSESFFLGRAAGAGRDRVGAAWLRALVREGRGRPAARSCKVVRRVAWGTPARGPTDFKGCSQICAFSRYLQKVSKFLVPSPLQSVTSEVSFPSVGWCDAKPTQLKSPGRHSSFPFPHLSPLRALRALPLFRACQQVGDQPKRERRDLRIY